MHVQRYKSSYLFWLLALAALIAPVRFTRACSVPVFRYALERWPADPYEVIVFHHNPLTTAERSAVDILSQATTAPAQANLRVRLVDPAGELDAPTAALWQRHFTDQLPWFVVLFPRVSGIKRLAWSGPLTAETAQAVTDSPLRREITRRILNGQSAVWVLLNGGDEKIDNAVAVRLKTQLARLSKSLELPAPVGPAGLTSDERGNPVTENLRVSFSLLRLSPRDPRERFLVGMLISCEPDLAELSAAGKPIAIPVYGRGRALYALVGEGITERNVRIACRSLVAACSCQVKREHPGIDLLIKADWSNPAGGRMVDDAALPSLTALTGVAPAKADRSEPSYEDDTVPSVNPGASTMWLRNTLFAAGFIVGCVILLTVLVLSKRRASRFGNEK